MAIFRVKVNDRRESFLHEASQEIVPVSQVMSREYKLFGLTVYHRNIDYTDNIKTTVKDSPGFKH